MGVGLVEARPVATGEVLLFARLPDDGDPSRAAGGRPAGLGYIEGTEAAGTAELHLGKWSMKLRERSKAYQ